MVIQRWQSVLLLISAILMSWSCFVPVAMVNGASPFQISDNVIMLIASIVIAVLYFVAIFMFSNLKRQMKFARAISILQALLLIGELVFIKTSQSAPVELTWGWIPALVSILCAIVAIRLMNRDHALLRSADRLR